MTVEEKVAQLIDAKTNGHRVTIELETGSRYENLGVVEITQPEFCQIETAGKDMVKPLLPYIVRFSTDDSQLVAFGTIVQKIKEVTIHVS